MIMNNDMNLSVGAGNLESNDVLKSRIFNNKLLVKKELATYAELAKNLKVAAKKQLDAGKKFTKKQNEKTENDFKVATIAYEEAYAEASASLDKFNQYMATIDADWTKMYEQTALINAKAAPKVKAEYDKYKGAVEAEKAKIDASLLKAEIELKGSDANAEEINEVTGRVEPVAAEPFEEEVEENEDEVVELEEVEPVVLAQESLEDDEEEEYEEEAPVNQYNAPQYSAPQYTAPQYNAPQYAAPQYMPPNYMPPQYVSYFMPPMQQPAPAPAPAAAPAQERNLAPITIDISARVEKVVNLAMEKVLS